MSQPYTPDPASIRRLANHATRAALLLAAVSKGVVVVAETLRAAADQLEASDAEPEPAASARAAPCATCGHRRDSHDTGPSGTGHCLTTVSDRDMSPCLCSYFKYPDPA